VNAPRLALVGLLLFGSLLAESVSATSQPAQAPVARDSAGANPVTVIQAYADGLAGGCAAKPGVRLSVGRDRSIPDERVLLVDYPVPTDDPAGRDVQCAATNHDWSAGRAISFHAKPSHPVRLSVSFFDKNRVAYTAWTELKGGVWQLVRIPFDEIRPNPFFQPPDAKTGATLDMSEVKGIAFAPQDRTSGRLLIGRFVVSK
jgi:hypothetical protein